MAEIVSFPNGAESPGLYYPQDYNLKTLNFLTANGQRIELKRILGEFSYYEDIYNFVSSGYVTVTDSQGFIELLQLTGNEYIEVVFSKIKNDPSENVQKFRVYKIGPRVPAGNLNTEFYTLYFCSEELLLSEQIKISKSYKGKEIYKIIENIVYEQLKIKKEKVQVIEKTKGVYDFIIPRLKPLEAISWLSTYARPLNYVGADMLFFETQNGYNFRSLQSMYADSVFGTYKYQMQNLPESVESTQEKFMSILNYEIVKPFDALEEISSGTFANKLISIDPLTRIYKTTTFNYDKFKPQAKTLNPNSPSNIIKNRIGTNSNENYDGTIKVVFGNANQQSVPYIKEKEAGVAKDIFVETYIPSRTAQIALANYTIIKAIVPGNASITAGRTVNIQIPSLKPMADGKEMDKFYSGKYLVTAVRHIIVPTGYQTVLELAKDSSAQAYQNINYNADYDKAVEG